MRKAREELEKRNSGVISYDQTCNSRETALANHWTLLFVIVYRAKFLHWIRLGKLTTDFLNKCHVYSLTLAVHESDSEGQV
jgi:hypothetical protein